jgi:hypothetical protein
LQPLLAYNLVDDLERVSSCIRKKVIDKPFGFGSLALAGFF